MSECQGPGDCGARGGRGVSLLLVLFLVGCLLVPAACRKERPEGEADRSRPLICYVGGTMRPAMEELVRLYRQQTGREVRLDYGDSGSLMIRIETERRGDLYVCHDPFLHILEAKGLGRGRAVAALTPTIVVAKGNPKNIRGLPDLGRDGLRLIMTDYTHSTLGNMLPVLLAKAGNEAAIRKNIVTTVRSGGQAANSVAIGRFDAALVWNAVAFLRRDKLDAVALPAEHLPVAGVDAVTSATGKTWDVSEIRVTIATLGCSKRPQAAQKFLDFVASDRGRRVFAQLGFSPARPAD